VHSDRESLLGNDEYDSLNLKSLRSV
jgi:hypothetical protein